jgi:hypothetical protein
MLRKGMFYYFAGSLLFGMVAILARAQDNNPLTCTANVAVTPTLRVEGLAEQTGDMIIRCTGGDPTPAGQFVPTANIRVFTNTTITSRIVNKPFSEVLLLVDEPAPDSQSPCPISNPNDFNLGGACPITGTGTGVSTYDGSAGHFNVFQGQYASPNSLTWQGIPFDPSGTQGQRVFRITNVRVNANQLGVASDGSAVPVTANISITGQNGTPIPVTNPFLTVGTVQTSLIYRFNSKPADDPTLPNAEFGSQFHAHYL